MKNKKVIFIGGTSYSGSTFLDMMLASGDEAVSTGELYALFYPHLPHHINPQCCCGNSSCSIWPKIKNKGISNLYSNIFEMFPKANFIVDSSKDPIWISNNSKILRRNGIDVQHVLIYKTPLEFAISRIKRNRLKNWDKSWSNYHKLYFSLIDTWHSVKYYDLATNPNETLKKICNKIGIDYFPEKELFWNYTHHTLFGNTSAKIHLFSDTSSKYKNYLDVSSRESSILSDHKHRSIYYDNNTDDNFNHQALNIIKNDTNIQHILELLEVTIESDCISTPIIEKLKKLNRFCTAIIYSYIGRNWIRKIFSLLYEKKQSLKDFRKNSER